MVSRPGCGSTTDPTVTAPGAVVVGSDVDPQPYRLMGPMGYNRVAVPALRLAAWNITGNAAG